MATQTLPPLVSLCYADPRTPFSRELDTVWRRGEFTRAAVAFLTEAGVEFFERCCLRRQNPEKCLLCFTVQWPTDLDAVARLSPLLGPNLRIHLASKTPVESGTDLTRMLHSKVIYTDHGNQTCTVFVGSHNWTGNALNGVNFEASVRVECETNNAFAEDIQSHLDRCAQGCVPFDPNDIDYYRAIQHVLSTARPSGPAADEVEAFEKLPGSPAVVIHAEGDEEQFDRSPLKLFLPVQKRSMAKWFSTTIPTNVFLFLYPKGTLLGHTSPSSRPVLYHGPVGANNDVKVSPSRATEVTDEIRNFDRPELYDVPKRNIPQVTNELYQVVAELHRQGPAEIPVYHRGRQPILEVGVRFADNAEEQFDGCVPTSRRPTLDKGRSPKAILGEYGSESIRNGVFVFREPMPERVVHLDIPGQWIYHKDVEEIVRRRLSRNPDQDGIRIALKTHRRKSAYMYQASFVLRY